MSAANTQTTDVVIIGAGPVGLFAVFECGMLGLNTCVVDAQEQVGGQCAALYPEKPIFDIPALPRVLAGELIQRLVEQAAPFNPTFFCGTEAVDLQRVGGERWRVMLSNDVVVDCGAVIIATGAGRLVPNKPEWANLGKFEGRGIHYSVPQKARFANRIVAIAGGGDSAADWSVELSSLARKIVLIHRRDRFRAAPETLQKIRELASTGTIEVLAPAKIHAVDGDEAQLRRMEVERDGHRSWIECDDALLFFGLAPDSVSYKRWSLDTQGSEIVVNAKTCATNLPGVFAIGDVAARPSKLKLILAGFSEAATASHQAYAYCRPGEELFPEYSTARGIPASS